MPLPTDPAAPPALRIGMVGAGFMAQFHLRALLGVRNAVLAGVWSPTPARRDAFAAAVNRDGLGPCTAFASQLMAEHVRNQVMAPDRLDRHGAFRGELLHGFHHAPGGIRLLPGEAFQMPADQTFHPVGQASAA